MTRSLFCKSFFSLATTAVLLWASGNAALACGKGGPSDPKVRFAIRSKDGQLQDTFYSRLQENLVKDKRLSTLLGRNDFLEPLLTKIKDQKGSCFVAFKSKERRGDDIFFRIVNVKASVATEVFFDAQNNYTLKETPARSVECNNDILELAGDYNYRRIRLRYDIAGILGNYEIISAVKEMAEAAKEKVRISISFFEPQSRCGYGSYMIEAKSLESDKSWGFLLDGGNDAKSEIFDATQVRQEVKAFHDGNAAKLKAAREALDAVTGELSKKIGFPIACYNTDYNHTSIEPELCAKGVAALAKAFELEPTFLEKIKQAMTPLSGESRLEGIRFEDHSYGRGGYPGGTELSFFVSATAEQMIQLVADIQAQKTAEYEFANFRKALMQKYNLKDFSCYLGPKVCEEAANRLLVPMAEQNLLPAGLRLWFSESSQQTSGSDAITVKPQTTVEQFQQLLVELAKKAEIAKAAVVIAEQFKKDHGLENFSCFDDASEECKKGMQYTDALFKSGKLKFISSVQISSFNELSKTTDSPGRKYRLSIDTTKSFEDLEYLVDEELADLISED